MHGQPHIRFKEHVVCFMTLLHVTSNSHTETQCNPNKLYMGTHTVTVHSTKGENHFLITQQKCQNNKPEKFSIMWWYTIIHELVPDVHVAILRKVMWVAYTLLLCDAADHINQSSQVWKNYVNYTNLTTTTTTKQHSQNFTLLWITQRIFLWKQKVAVIESLESNSINTDNV